MAVVALVAVVAPVAIVAIMAIMQMRGLPLGLHRTRIASCALYGLYSADCMCGLHRADCIVRNYIASSCALYFVTKGYAVPKTDGFVRCFRKESPRGIRADSEVAIPIVGEPIYVLPSVTANKRQAILTKTVIAPWCALKILEPKDCVDKSPKLRFLSTPGLL